MKRQQAAIAAILSGLFIFTGCTSKTGSDMSEQASQLSPTVLESSDSSAMQEEKEYDASPSNAQPDYINQLVQETIAEFEQPGMSEYEKVKAAFDYMIETKTLLDPVGLDLWRIRGDYSEPPSYLENRSLSILLFDLGKCEDYAAALTLLLRGMGLEAEYVPGLTYSTQGELVDHAWTVVKIDGVWYHLDCQLEQNISRHGSIRYKYFLRSDATMAGSHRWGQDLVNSGLLTQEQNEEITENYIPPACPENYATPERHTFTLARTPDLEAIMAAIEVEFQQYEAIYGMLEPMELNIIPPVFALEGYGPQD